MMTDLLPGQSLDSSTSCFSGGCVSDALFGALPDNHEGSWMPSMELIIVLSIAIIGGTNDEMEE
ncbi:hypothetical protein [Bifidobacterium sp. UTBIF-78]|uniref:hypothetical protein n=1 Tax=Bifidobacterium sp. UTBIF-78 TaxID=1465263 RepID=UPI00112C908A|nr:hypothetical protein [Bifidobacterium sp. UTBIF-78]TPF95830.1 hypothetical protein BG22_00965 [Bifidobacterium sp. UTBIF-78]